MQIRFLVIDHRGIFLLGYPLKLSATEAKLLYEIAKGGKSSADDLLLLLSEGVSRGNVAVHVNSINRKAHKISGRKLIIHQDGEYKINPYM